MCMATGETGVSGQPMGGGWRRLAFHLLLPWPSGLLLLQLADTAGWRDRRRRKRQAGYGRRRCWSLAPAGGARLCQTPPTTEQANTTCARRPLPSTTLRRAQRRRSINLTPPGRVRPLHLSRRGCALPGRDPDWSARAARCHPSSLPTMA